MGERLVFMRKLSMAIPVIIAVAAVMVMPVNARENKIESGIYADDIDLSGMIFYHKIFHTE